MHNSLSPESGIRVSWDRSKWELFFFFSVVNVRLFFIFLAERGSEDIDILPNGLAFISSVSARAPSLRRGYLQRAEVKPAAWASLLPTWLAPWDQPGLESASPPFPSA